MTTKSATGPMKIPDFKLWRVRKKGTTTDMYRSTVKATVV